MRVRATPFLTFGLLLFLAAGRAQESSPSENQLKAAFLFNFAKFIEWPAEVFTNAEAPFLIGVVGDKQFGEDIAQTVRNKLVNGHPVTVKVGCTLEEARLTHILFISASEKKRMNEIIDKMKGASVLTVSETERFTEAGGMINFVSENKKIRFQINDAAAKTAGLKISSKLLSLAVRSG
jgi:hypothetical protein